MIKDKGRRSIYVEKGLRDWSLITGRGATKLKGGGASVVSPPHKGGGGGGNVLVMLRGGGHTEFWGSFFHGSSKF